MENVSIRDRVSSSDSSRLTFRRLLLAKQIYLHGLEHSNRADPLNKMIAVHNFHNAIEITLRAILLEHGIRAEKHLNIEFEVMLTEIDNHKDFQQQNIRLPYRQELRNLNQLRNLVQHHVVEPPNATMEDWRVFTRKFLEQTYQTYFGLNFNDISSVDMISDQLINRMLVLARSELETGDIKKGITLVKVSFDWASDSVLDFLPKGQIPGLLNDAVAGSREHELIDRGNYVLNLVMRTALYYSAILASGVNPVNYKRFRELMPTLEFFTSVNGEKTEKRIQIHWEHTLDSESALWVYEFVVDTIVNWQSLGLAVDIRGDRLDWAERLIGWGDDVISN